MGISRSKRKERIEQQGVEKTAKIKTTIKKKHAEKRKKNQVGLLLLSGHSAQLAQGLKLKKSFMTSAITL